MEISLQTQTLLACKHEGAAPHSCCFLGFRFYGRYAERLHECLTDEGRGSPNKSQSRPRRREINAGLLIRRPLGCGECGWGRILRLGGSL